MNRDQLAKIIQQAIKQTFKVDFEPEVESADPKFGDYSTNAAFGLAQRLKKSPVSVAKGLAGAIAHDDIAEAKAAGPYVNIVLAPQFWLQQLDSIDSKYGSSKAGGGKKMQVEFISANPTGPLTLGNARGGFIGDVLARVLAHNGYHVTREYYFNDAGSQIAKLVESVKAAAGLIQPEEVQYKGEYIEKLAEQFKAELKSQTDTELGHILTEAIFKQYLQPAIKKMGIKFDVWFNEKDLVGAQFEAALERLKQAGLYEQKEGAVWAKTTKLGDDRDRPIIKTSGDVTYLGNDIAYHLNIFEQRGFDGAIKVWGADHAGQVPSLSLTMKKLTPDKQLDFLILQFVRLMRDGREVKMSKRAGTFVTTDELIDEVGPDVARFFFLMRSADSHMDFDLDLAKEESQKNPYWYVMYSYVRASSILQQAKSQGLKVGSAAKTLSPTQRQIVKTISQFADLMAGIAADYGVHRLTFYGVELAKLFHDYYESGHILSLSADQAAGELYFVQQFKTFMEVYFEILGITPVAKM